MIPNLTASRPWMPLAVVLAIASLYFGKDVLMPLALALLLSFLLTLLERWKFRRIPAVLMQATPNSVSRTSNSGGVVGRARRPAEGQRSDRKLWSPPHGDYIRSRLGTLRTGWKRPLVPWRPHPKVRSRWLVKIFRFPIVLSRRRRKQCQSFGCWWWV
jgi:hypothetical protein